MWRRIYTYKVECRENSPENSHIGMQCWSPYIVIIILYSFNDCMVIRILHRIDDSGNIICAMYAESQNLKCPFVSFSASVQLIWLSYSSCDNDDDLEWNATWSGMGCGTTTISSTMLAWNYHNVLCDDNLVLYTMLTLNYRHGMRTIITNK